MRSLSFNEELHEYRVDGISVPSVTQIVQAVTGKDLSKIPAKTLKAAGERGTAIHSDVELGTLESEEAQWIEQQIDRAGCEFELQGCGEIDGFVYAGTTDNLERETLRDWKSQASPDVFGWTLQLNLYRNFDQLQTKTGALLEACPRESVNKLEVLHVPKAGGYKSFPIVVLSDEQMKEVIAAYRENRVLDPSFVQGEDIVNVKDLVIPDIDISEMTLGTLTTNAKEVLATIRKMKPLFKAENYSEDNLAEAKRVRADINNLAKNANAKRLDNERKFMHPFDEYKDTVSDIVTECKSISGIVDEVIKSVEQREKDDRKQRLKSFFTEQNWNKVDFEKLFNQSMVNKGTKERDAQNEILARMKKIDTDLILLERVNELDATAFYLDTLNIDEALREADRIKNNRQRLAEMKARESAPVVQIVAPIAPSAEGISARCSYMPEPEAQEITSPATATITAVAPIAEELILTRVMQVSGTREQLVALTEYMDAQGIEWDKIEQ